MAKKLRIGWFSFSCCEDSTIVFVELLNQHFFEWKEKIDFAYCRVLHSRKDITHLDVAFVEGAIAGKDDVKRLKRIRQNSKYLVAIGACAMNGMPSSQRNMFDKKTKDEILPIMCKFGQRDTVVPLKDLVHVDDNVPGCPMIEPTFLAVLDKYMKEFKVA